MKSFFLVESLIRSGRKQIVHIQGPDDIYNSIERVRGYKDALAKFGIPFDKNNMLILQIDLKEGDMPMRMMAWVTLSWRRMRLEM